MASFTEATPNVANMEIRHDKLIRWVDEIAQLCKPDNVYWCDGSDQEYQEMLRLMVHAGTAIWMNPEKRANSVFVRSTPASHCTKIAPRGTATRA